jgi:probable H4MPT-linked C1 transfer pathway protein
MNNSPRNKQSVILGWDVGGAHLKAALVDAAGCALAVIQVPCPLWRGLNELQLAIENVMSQLAHALAGRTIIQHVVTMTGELADIFPHRPEGVVKISALMVAALGENTRFYAGKAGLVSAAAVSRYAIEIASANWQASADFVAQRKLQGLFIDIGSTTADFVLFNQHRVLSRGSNDGERLQFEELIYSGVVRTPLMALGNRIPFAGEWQTLAAEHFATTADIYRLTGDLKAAEDMAETADGSGKTLDDSARRIARMIGRDLQSAPISAWIRLAEAFKQMQLNQLKNAAMRNLSCGLIDSHAPFVGAGAGSFLVRELALQLNRRYCDIDSLITGSTSASRRWAGVCLPAYAVACIAKDAAA